MNLILDPTTGKPFQQKKEPAMQLKLPKVYACREHARQARRAGVVNQQDWAQALLYILLKSPKFLKLIGQTRGNVKGEREINLGLQRVGRLCCFMAGPQRRQAIDLALRHEGTN